MKKFQQEQSQIAEIKEFVARFGHGSAKLARQAQSREKILGKMEAAGLTERVVKDKVSIVSCFRSSCGVLCCEASAQPPPSR
jgi:ATP-binding cassette, subfamily F, member 2